MTIASSDRLGPSHGVLAVILLKTSTASSFRQWKPHKPVPLLDCSHNMESLGFRKVIMGKVGDINTLSTFNDGCVLEKIPPSREIDCELQKCNR